MFEVRHTLIFHKNMTKNNQIGIKKLFVLTMPTSEHHSMFRELINNKAIHSLNYRIINILCVFLTNH